MQRLGLHFLLSLQVLMGLFLVVMEEARIQLVAAKGLLAVLELELEPMLYPVEEVAMLGSRGATSF